MAELLSQLEWAILMGAAT